MSAPTLRQDGPDDRSADAPRTPAVVPAADDVAAAALARVRDVTGELVRLVTGAAAHAADGWSLVSVVRPLVPELDRVFEERDALDHEVALLRTDLADADERIRELEAQQATRQSGWNAERAMLETELGRERDQVQMLTEELERRRAEGELLATRERRVREQMEAVAARAHADREETLRLARDMVQSAEDARLAVVDEMDRLRAALADEQASLVEIQHERAIVTQDAAERQAELARARQIIEQLEGSRISASGELARARAKLVETESELLAAQHEYQLSQVQIDKLCSAHDDLVEDRAQLVARLHEAKEREARLRLRITGLEQRIQAVHDGKVAVESPAETTLDATASGLALELSRTEERARMLESELVKAKAAASAASLRADALQEQTRSAEQARMAVEAELRTARENADAHRRCRDVVAAAIDPEPVVSASHVAHGAAPAAPTTTVPDLTSSVTTVEVPVPVAETTGTDDVQDVAGLEHTAASAIEQNADELTRVELEPIVADDAADVARAEHEPGPVFAAAADVSDAAVASEPRAYVPRVEVDGADVALDASKASKDEREYAAELADDAAAPQADVESVAIIAGHGTWSGDAGIAAHVVAPADATCERLREIAPACCVVSVGEPGAIEAAAALRAGDVDTPLFGCLGDGAHAVALGRIDVLSRPVDPDRVRARLQALAGGGNVVMVGSESGILIPLRQGVQQAGLSVKTAWNRVQATELADTVRPDVVIVDLASEPGDCAALLCELAQRAAAPRLVLVLGTPAHHDELRAALIACTRQAPAVDGAALLRVAVAAVRT